MAKPLTAAAVAKVTAPSNAKYALEIPDPGARGLRLSIQPSGTKSWILRFRRPNGKSAKLTLGPVDLSGHEAADKPEVGHPLTLAAARALAADLNRERERGRDIAAHHVAARRQKRLEAQEGAERTFGAAALAFIDKHARKEQRRWKETARLLGIDPEGLDPIKGGLAQRWKDTPVVAIDDRQIEDVVDEARHDGVPGLARKNQGPSEARARAFLSALSTLFDWLKEPKNRRRWQVRRNPCADITRPAAPKARDHWLSDPEIVAFWHACDGEAQPFGQVLKLLLLTGCRLNEVAGMRKSELSDDRAIWTIPGTRTKNKLAHFVPLSPLARDLLATVKPVEGDFMFTTTGRSPVSGWSKLKARIDERAGIRPWRLHDLRRTAATGMAEIGIPPHIVEAALNHVSGAKSGVAGTYNRAAYANEKKTAFERWASHIAGLIEKRPSNVAPFARAKTKNR